MTKDWEVPRKPPPPREPPPDWTVQINPKPEHNPWQEVLIAIMVVAFIAMWLIVLLAAI